MARVRFLQNIRCLGFLSAFADRLSEVAFLAALAIALRALASALTSFALAHFSGLLPETIAPQVVHSNRVKFIANPSFECSPFVALRT